MRILSPLIFLIACTACSSAPPVAVERLHASSYCGDETGGIRFIDTAQLQTLMRSDPLTHAWGAPDPAPVDTKGKHLLLISLGQKPSGGYGLMLQGDSVEVEDGILRLPIRMEEPPPGSMQTRQITRPCLVIGLGPGNYREVQVPALPGMAARAAAP
jgi:hypothetical protein